VINFLITAFWDLYRFMNKFFIIILHDNLTLPQCHTIVTSA